MKHFISLAIAASLAFSAFAAEPTDSASTGFQFTDQITVPTNSVKDQNKSGTCWCFSGLSFIEDDILRRIENCCLKLDSAIDRTITLLDRPTNPNFTAEHVIERIAAVGPQVIVQTMITRGSHDGVEVDNSTDAEIAALIEAYRRIRPREIQLYSLDRPTPELSLQKVPRAELDTIAERITAATGIHVAVVG